mmetsp:Transcript_13942/g.17396  ORF Transcript_13942/g.17396 Transcript_13942/m.17396 type:complete len:156 (-) Transcript_13942:349-816(-)
MKLLDEDNIQISYDDGTALEVFSFDEDMGIYQEINMGCIQLLPKSMGQSSDTQTLLLLVAAAAAAPRVKIEPVALLPRIFYYFMIPYTKIQSCYFQFPLYLRQVFILFYFNLICFSFNLAFFQLFLLPLSLQRISFFCAIPKKRVPKKEKEKERK